MPGETAPGVHSCTTLMSEAYRGMLGEMRPSVHSCCITLILRPIVACLRISGVLVTNSQFSSFLLIAKKASATLVSHFSSSQNFLTPMPEVYWIPTTVLEMSLGILL